MIGLSLSPYVISCRFYQGNGEGGIRTLGTGKTIEFDIFLVEPSAVDPNGWPGKNSMNTALVVLTCFQVEGQCGLSTT